MPPNHNNMGIKINIDGNQLTFNLVNFLKIIIGIKIMNATPIPLPSAVNANASKTTSIKPRT